MPGGGKGGECGVRNSARVTDPAAEARPDHAKSRSNRRNALKSTGPRTVAGKALVDSEVASGPEPFARLPVALQAQLLQVHGVAASGIAAVVIAEYGSWPALVDQHVRLFDQLLEQQHIRELSLLVIESQTLPTQTELLGRYQTALDNDLYKALKALREAQSWRQAKAVLAASAVPAAGEG